MNNTIAKILKQRVCETPERIAFVFIDEKKKEFSLTYLDLHQKARAIAATLQEKYKPGERALLVYPPGLEFVFAFFGCLYAGLIPVPVYPPSPFNIKKSLVRLKGVYENSGSSVILTLKSIETFSYFVTFVSAELKKISWLSTDAVNGKAEDKYSEFEADENDIAFLQYTSGSTSAPKGVMVTHKNLIFNSESIYRMACHDENSVYVCWVPSFHDMGLIGGIIQPVYGGFKGVLLSPLTFLKNPVSWFETIHKHKGTTSPFPNFALDFCVNRIKDEDLQGLDLSSWKLGCNGAEPIRKESLDRFYNKFKAYGYRKETMYPAYGLAEGTLIVSGGKRHEMPKFLNVNKELLKENRLKTEDNLKNSVQLVGCGKSVEGQEIRIVNPDTLKACKENEIGEIWVRGESIAKGYWNNEEKSREVFQAFISDTGDGPFLRTGDLGFLYEDELFVTGRLKDIIIIRGTNHYPQDIEYTVQNLKKDFPAIRQGCGAAFSVDVNGEEELVVFQELTKDSRNPSKELIASIRTAINENHDINVNNIVLLEAKSIPKTSSGKIRRHACQEAFLKGLKNTSFKVIASWPEGKTALTLDNSEIKNKMDKAEKQKSLPGLITGILKQNRKAKDESRNNKYV